MQWGPDPRRPQPGFEHVSFSYPTPGGSGFGGMPQWGGGPPQYAAPGASQTSATPSRPISADEMREVKLYSGTREREKYDNLANLYSIIVTVEHLEKAYSNDAVREKEYTPACARLIAQFKSALTLCKDSVTDVRQFMADFKMSCPAAEHTLLVTGVPRSVENGGDSGGKGGATAVAECVHHFITTMDSLKLNMTAVDEIHPLFSDLLDALNKVVGLPAEYEGKRKVKEWLVTLNKMRAVDSINEDQVRQMLFDLEGAYSGFFKSLEKKK